MTAELAQDSPVLFEERATQDGGLIGIATLNVPRALNSLGSDMVDLLLRRLQQWQKSDDVRCVWLQAAGEKAFCAGGDVRKLHDSVRELGRDVRNPVAENFFSAEYRLDYLIHTFGKPLIVWGHGIVMGGGMGLLVGASHRVVTEASRLAMPEISIGLFPDVGGSWMLSRAPGRTGLFLGLTGAAMNAADALFAGYADRFILHVHRDAVLCALEQVDWQLAPAQTLVNDVLRDFDEVSRLQRPLSKLREHLDLINDACDADDVAQAVEQICCIESDDPWVQKSVATLAAGCPVTAHLVWEQLHRGRHLSLAEVFRMELVVAVQCCRHPDFIEGVRAVLVDKDGKPSWQHGDVASVPAAWVEAHFRAPWPGAGPLADLGVAGLGAADPGKADWA